MSPFVVEISDVAGGASARAKQLFDYSFAEMQFLKDRSSASAASLTSQGASLSDGARFAFDSLRMRMLGKTHDYTELLKHPMPRDKNGKLLFAERRSPSF